MLIQDYGKREAWVWLEASDEEHDQPGPLLLCAGGVTSLYVDPLGGFVDILYADRWLTVHAYGETVTDVKQRLLDLFGFFEIPDPE